MLLGIRADVSPIKAFEPWRDAMLEQEAGEQHKLALDFNSEVYRP